MKISQNEQQFFKSAFTDIQFAETKGVEFLQFTIENPLFLKYQKTLKKQANDEKRHSQIFACLLSSLTVEDKMLPSKEVENFCAITTEIAKTPMSTVAINTILETSIMGEFAAYKSFWKKEKEIVEGLESVLKDETRHSMFGLQWLSIHGEKKELSIYEPILLEWIDSFREVSINKDRDSFLSKKRLKELDSLFEENFSHSIMLISKSLENAKLYKSAKLITSIFE